MNSEILGSGHRHFSHKIRNRVSSFYHTIFASQKYHRKEEVGILINGNKTSDLIHLIALFCFHYCSISVLHIEVFLYIKMNSRCYPQ